MFCACWEVAYKAPGQGWCATTLQQMELSSYFVEKEVPDSHSCGVMQNQTTVTFNMTNKKLLLLYSSVATVFNLRCDILVPLETILFRSKITWLSLLLLIIH